MQYSVSGLINSDPDSLMIFNETLEDFAFSQKLNQRRIFEIENCLEELSIRILAKCPDAQIQIDINYDDTLSARVHYEGQRYNPLHIEKDEDELGIRGLKLLKHRALRAAFRYHSPTNYIHVVI